MLADNALFAAGSLPSHLTNSSNLDSSLESSGPIESSMRHDTERSVKVPGNFPLWGSMNLPLNKPPNWTAVDCLGFLSMMTSQMPVPSVLLLGNVSAVSRRESLKRDSQPQNLHHGALGSKISSRMIGDPGTLLP
jgi:hypothetical protein